MTFLPNPPGLSGSAGFPDSSRDSGESTPRRLLPRRLSVRLPLLTAFVVSVAFAATMTASGLALWSNLLAQVDARLSSNMDYGARSAWELLSEARGEVTTSNKRSETNPNTREIPGSGNVGNLRDAQEQGNDSSTNKTGIFPIAGDEWGPLQIVATNTGGASSLVVHAFQLQKVPAEDARQIADAARAQVWQSETGMTIGSNVALTHMGKYRIVTQYLRPTGPGLQNWQRVSPTAAREAQEAGQLYLQVIMGTPLSQIYATTNAFLLRFGMYAVIGVCISAGAAWLLVTRQLRPLRNVAQAARDVTNQDLTHGSGQVRLRISATDADPETEAGQVGQAFNVMLSHVSSALVRREEASSQIRQFVADASHELRTPLSSISGYAELLAHLDLPADSRGAITRIVSESGRMKLLVDDLLLLARLENGRPWEVSEVDLAPICIDSLADAAVAGQGHVWHLDLALADPDAGDFTDFAEESVPAVDAKPSPVAGELSGGRLPGEPESAQESVQESAHESVYESAHDSAYESAHESAYESAQGKDSNCQILASTQPLAPQWPVNLPVNCRWQGAQVVAGDLSVSGNDARLRQILANLLANARQHTPSGTSVTVAARRLHGLCPAAAGVGDWVCAWIIDDGPGIADEVRSRIFDRFVRADSARAAGTSTGLGLSIAAAIAGAHGGYLRLLDTPKGTIFEMCLPVFFDETTLPATAVDSPSPA